jgi:hypothetical protein
MIRRKLVVMVVLLGFVAGWSFAQTGLAIPRTEPEPAPQVEPEPEPDTETAPKTAPEPKPKPVRPKNLITVDLGPTIVGGLYSGMGKLVEAGASGLNYSGFGIGAQYERQINDRLSLAGRFAYLGFGTGISASDGGDSVDLSMKLFSFSVEGHARFFMVEDIFFLDGMLGYASLTSAFSGAALITQYDENGWPLTTKKRESVAYTATRSYLKLGAKIGVRVDFGKPGGFIFEPAFGYYYGGIGLGDTLGKKLSSDLGEDVSDVDPLFEILEKVIFIGGPRLSLAFGWRF